MSVSMRSTKAQMYSEIERLRNHVDHIRQQLRSANDEIDRLRAKYQAPNIPKCSSKINETAKAFATKYKCTARIRNGVIELYSRSRKCWVAVPDNAQP